MTAVSACWAWLTAGLSGEVHVAPDPWVYWHARLMVAGWSVVLPLGILIARYFKVTSRQNWPEELDNKFWWRMHVRLQSTGIVLMSVGALCVLNRGSGGGGLVRLHGLMGWGLVAVGWLQIVGGVLRGSKGGPTTAVLRGDHFDMTRRRLVFERIHKGLGWLALPCVVVATAAGLVVVDAPRWMVLMLAGWWLALVAAFLVLHRSGRWVDTYHAIWGLDPTLPGNRHRPVPPGVALYPRHQKTISISTVDSSHRQ